MSLHLWKRWFAFAALVLAAVMVFTGCTGPQGSVAFTVNDLEVEKAELIHYMKQNTSLVAAELEEAYGLDSDADDFWTKEEQGIVPLDYLKDYTVKEITRTKIEQLCAKEHGISTALYYSQQLKERDRINKERREAEAAGEILYGPTERDFIAYFAEFYLDMQRELQQKMADNGEIRVSPEDVQRFYDQNTSILSGSLEENWGIIYTSLLKDAYDAFIEDRMQAASVQDRDMEIDADEVV